MDRLDSILQERYRERLKLLYKDRRGSKGMD